jgi:hypothetical protein
VLKTSEELKVQGISYVRKLYMKLYLRKIHRIQYNKSKDLLKIMEEIRNLDK